MHVDPRRLLVLLSVHRAGGVLAAAQINRMSPSAVSQQIAALEREVGVVVLDRQPAGAVLTDAGRVLAEAAERIEAELLEASKGLAVLQNEVSGLVTIGAFQTVIRAVLLPLVGTIEAKWPGIRIEVHEVTFDEGRQSLRAGELDLLLIEADESPGHAPPRGTRDVPVLDEPWWIVAPAVWSTPTSLSDLGDVTWLGVDDGAAAHRAMMRLHVGYGIDPPIRHMYADYDVALSMVAAGLGVTLIPALAVAGVDLPDVQTVALPGLGSRRLVARHRSTRSEPTREVSTVLEEIVRQASASATWTDPAPTGA